MRDTPPSIEADFAEETLDFRVAVLKMLRPATQVYATTRIIGTHKNSEGDLVRENVAT